MMLANPPTSPTYAPITHHDGAAVVQAIQPQTRSAYLIYGVIRSVSSFLPGEFQPARHAFQTPTSR